MARAAFLMDRFMRSFGLEGRAFVPLLSSFACAIPGIMAARTLASHKQRLITIAIAPLMSCSARLPVYVLLISAFIPDKRVWLFNMQSFSHDLSILFRLIYGDDCSIFDEVFIKGRESVSLYSRTPWIQAAAMEKSVLFS